MQYIAGEMGRLKSPLSKTAQFRNMLASPHLEFIMEAHNGLSAKVVQEAGFPGIWASGLTISSALGVRDSNEASWTQILDVLEFMADATTIPILLDGDTGYGNFNNFRRLVHKLEQRNIAAVCIEDKLFPKTNSFLGSSQPLAGIDEFCGKIKAGKDSQSDDDFCIVARIEALISGWGMDDALRRAEAYHAAGTDAILIHSKISTADEIMIFAREWANRCPLAIVPTTYASTPTERFREAGISLIIWANHNLRSAITAMRETSRSIFENQSLHDVEGKVTTLDDVFWLAGNEELAEAEDRYLATRNTTSAIVLAASRGETLSDLTEDKPKCMLDIRGQPLLRRLTRAMNDSGIQNISVVAGYIPEAIDLPNIKKVVNLDYASTGEAASLGCAVDALDGDCVISYGDILFGNYMLGLLITSTADIIVVVDASWQARHLSKPKTSADLVQCSMPYSVENLDYTPITLERVDSALDWQEAHGAWVGLVRLSKRGASLVRQEIEAMTKDDTLRQANLPDIFNRLIARGEKPAVLYVNGDWLNVNDVFDLDPISD